MFMSFMGARSAAATLAALLWPLCAFAQPTEAEQFEQLRSAINANCGDCYGASKDVFLKAAGKLESLVANGFDLPEARMLLARAYETWAFVYVKSDSPDVPVLRDKARQLYLGLTIESPDDPEAWVAYADSLDDPKEALEALGRAERLAPRDPYIKYSLGMTYAHALNKPEAGVRYIEEAVALESGYRKINYLEQLAGVYEIMNDNERASQARSRLEDFRREFESGMR